MVKDERKMVTSLKKSSEMFVFRWEKCTFAAKSRFKKCNILIKSRSKKC